MTDIGIVRFPSGTDANTCDRVVNIGLRYDWRIKGCLGVNGVLTVPKTAHRPR
jgi:hypothetical protein